MKPVVLLPLVDFLVKFVLYLAGMKVRKLPLQGMTAALCAGSSLLAGLVPLPMMVHFAAGIAVACYFLHKNADAELYPDAIGIVLAVEFSAAFIMRLGIGPLLDSLS